MLRFSPVGQFGTITYQGMMTAAALERFFPPGFLQRLERPLGESTALPNAAYTEAEFLQLERQQVEP